MFGFKKIFLAVLVSGVLLGSGVPMTLADTPAAKPSEALDNTKGIIPWNEGANCTYTSFQNTREMSIGHRMKCGTVNLSDVPKQIVYWITLILKLLPSVAVVFVLVAGGYYLYGAVSGEGTEKAKNALIYAVAGLVVAFVAWWLVDWLQQWITN